MESRVLTYSEKGVLVAKGRTRTHHFDVSSDIYVYVNINVDVYVYTEIYVIIDDHVRIY